jgi:SAM-dependent methyltransferase
MSNNIDELSVRKTVKERYSELAKGGSPCCSGNDYTEYIGYSLEEVSKLPDEVVEVSAGCGNPTAIAGLEPGQTVLDLGSGGGIDVFLSARAVGPEGKAIGVDATPEMIWRARKAAKEMGTENVEFRLGEIECMPVESNTVDVVISNCVINLSPDKDKVFAEAFRVLKPGGKLAVSDMVLTGDLEADELDRFRTWASCVGGAIALDEYTGKMKAAGFEDIKVESKHTYTKEELMYMVSEPCGCGGESGARAEGLREMADIKALSKVATVKISARKK